VRWSSREGSICGVGGSRPRRYCPPARYAQGAGGLPTPGIRPKGRGRPREAAPSGSISTSRRHLRQPTLVDLLLLQRAGNWSSLKMVERYAHVREGRDAEVMRQMEAARTAWEGREHSPQATPRPIARAPRNA